MKFSYLWSFNSHKPTRVRLPCLCLQSEAVFSSHLRRPAYAEYSIVFSSSFVVTPMTNELVEIYS